ncbi:60S ribosomal protein L17 [Striga asiatica]|uniref:60S ribosomal protein L17 n=1 Tax=Striga asiatica TaxID=4170 RepID=A0A5A7R7M4_STRAF|nr:60S ribosomal protein L17 [Striga asiatica]
MDQGIWDSLEDSQFSETPAEIESYLNSPIDRVRAMVGGDFPASLGFSGWAEQMGKIGSHSRGFTTWPTKSTTPLVSSLITKRKGWSATKSNKSTGLYLEHVASNIESETAAASVPCSSTSTHAL